ncbi:lamin-C-like [Musca autumnalis]|uniref:lamin-C-like n=1 Tax=Musca autumnalis TaxID=221902 RepID=UPI003CF42721
MKVKDYEEINGKWVPKINTRQVDSNSIRKVENVTILELKKIVKFTGSVGETTGRKNENVRADVSLKFKSEINQLREENEQLKTRLDQRTKACSISEEKARIYGSQVADVSAKYNAAHAKKEKAVEKLGEVQKESECLRKQLDEARKYLNAESMIRTDLQNRIQSLRDELTFKEQNHLREIDEIYSSHQLKISVVDERLCEQYKALLKQSLQELREQHEGQMRKMKMLYEQKIKDLQAEANRESVAASSAIEELDVSRQNIESLYIRISKLEATNAALNGRNCDLEKLLANERRRHAYDIANVESELQWCRDKMAQQHLEYQGLMAIKDSLDFEVAAYEKLLCGSVKDDIDISECEPKAEFFKVPKKGTNEVQTVGRRVKRKIRLERIDGGASAPGSQWYATSAAHEPANIVMKSLKWQCGESIKRSPCNAVDEEADGADDIKRTVISRVSCHGATGTGARSCLQNGSSYEERFIGKQYPTKSNVIYKMFHRWKKDPRRHSWLLKVLGAIT